MATLAANEPRAYEGGDRNDLPVIGDDIIYEGAAVGVVSGSGLARPLQAGDKFGGFAKEQADNTGGAAGAITVRTQEKGKVKLNVGGAAITDIDAPIYASDDNTFTKTATSNTLIGFVHRFVDSGVVIVDYDVAYAKMKAVTEALIAAEHP